MAFTATSLSIVSSGTLDSPRLWSYNAGADSLATIAATGYFNSMINSMASGDRIFISTSTGNLNFEATVVNNGTNISLQFANTRTVYGQFANISGSASTIYIPGIPAGIITQVFGVQFNAITVASAVLTFSLGSTALTGGVLTVTTAGAAGTQYSAVPTANNVCDGTLPLNVASNGGSTTACIMVVGARIVTGAQSQ